MLTQEQMFERLLSKFGYADQLKKFVEELGELTASIMRLMLTKGEAAKGFKTSEKEMLYELFDVEFMTQQISYHYIRSSKESQEFYHTTRKTWQKQQQNKLEQYLKDDSMVVADRLHPFYPTNVSSQSPLNVGVLGHSVLYQSSTVKQGVQHTQSTIITPNDVDEDELEALYFHLENVQEHLYKFDRAKIPKEFLESYDYVGELIEDLRENIADVADTVNYEEDVETDE
jgi:hypothetical protein